jgi:hypothetical protein
MIMIFEKYPWAQSCLTAIALFISILVLDSIWHPFPLEYHFGWWFLWFQISLYLLYERRWAMAVACWFYLLWITMRGLPWGRNWKTTWRPFWTAFLGDERIQHWERWSYKSVYSIELLVDQDIYELAGHQQGEPNQMEENTTLTASAPNQSISSGTSRKDDEIRTRNEEARAFVQQVNAEVSQTDLKQNSVPPGEEEEKGSTISDMSFDIDLTQMDAIEQEYRENKMKEEKENTNS